MEQKLTSEVFEEEAFDEEWLLMVNGASNKSRAGTGMVLITPNGSTIEMVVKLDFTASSNEGEYEALLCGLIMTTKLRIKRVRVCIDLKLIAFQVKTKHERIMRYKAKVNSLIKSFAPFNIENISRCDNEVADNLVILASTNDDIISVPIMASKKLMIKSRNEVMLLAEDEEGVN